MAVHGDRSQVPEHFAACWRVVGVSRRESEGYGRLNIRASSQLILLCTLMRLIPKSPAASLQGKKRCRRDDGNSAPRIINVITRHKISGGTIEASGGAASFLGRTGRLTTSVQKGKLSGLFSGSLYRSAGQARLFFPEFAAPETNNGWAVDVDGDRSGQAFGDLQYGNLRVQDLFSTRTKIIPTGPLKRSTDPANRSIDSRAYVDLSYHRAVSLVTSIFVPTPTGTPFWALPLTLPAVLWGKAWGRPMGRNATMDRQIGRHTIVVGADYEYSIKVKQQNRLVGKPALFVDRRQPSRAALYGEAELNLIPKLSIRLGASLDWFSTYGNSLSPRIAFVYSPNSRTALKYIYGQAFPTPNVYENYYADKVVLDAPDKPLRPETIGSNEVILERGLSP